MKMRINAGMEGSGRMTKYVCPICNRKRSKRGVLFTLRGLKQHINKNHEKEAKCPACGKFSPEKLIRRR